MVDNGYVAIIGIVAILIVAILMYPGSANADTQPPTPIISKCPNCDNANVTMEILPGNDANSGTPIYHCPKDGTEFVGRKYYTSMDEVRV